MAASQRACVLTIRACGWYPAVYLVVADEAYGRQIPFAFLERVRDEFEEKFADKGRVSAAHSLDASFRCAGS